MPSHLAPHTRLKALCREHGILNLAHLCAFMEVQPGRSTLQIAEASNQSRSSTGQWLNLFEIHGLMTRTWHRRNCTIALTPEGEVLRTAILSFFKA